MFDVETFLKRKGISEKCAKIVTELFGDVLSLSTLSSAHTENGIIYIPQYNLTISPDEFAYYKENVYREDKRGGNYFEGSKMLMSYKDGKLTVGELKSSGIPFVGPNNKNVPDYQLRYLELPDDWFFGHETGKFSYYDSGSTADFLLTRYPDYATFDQKQNISMLMDVLSSKDQLSESYMSPDFEDDWFIPATKESQKSELIDLVYGKTRLEKIMNHQDKVMEEEVKNPPIL